MDRPEQLPDRDPALTGGSVNPYTALAPLYDRIMAHVDYAQWADYLLTLCSRFAAPPARVLELGCGTGNLTFRLSRGLDAEFLATDFSVEMLAVAKQKASRHRSKIDFEVVDFRRIELEGPFDVVVLAYDGINYLLASEQVKDLVDKVATLLGPGGLFLFDQSTPANSINNLALFDDHWKSEGASYARASQYDAAREIHMTRFDIRIGQEQMSEVHFQKAYGLREMEMTLKLSSLQVEGCFDAFTFDPATTESERIQWVLSKPRSVD